MDEAGSPYPPRRYRYFPHYFGHRGYTSHRQGQPPDQPPEESETAYKLTPDTDVLPDGKVVVEDVKGDVRRIHLERVAANAGSDKPATKAGGKAAEPVKKVEPAASGLTAPTSIDVLYVVGGDDLVLGAGYDAKAVLRMALDASAKDNLATRNEVTAAMKSLGDKAAFVVIADLIRLLAKQTGTTPTGPGAPLLFAVGKGGEGFGADEPWMRLDVANVVIQELVKRRGAF